MKLGFPLQKFTGEYKESVLGLKPGGTRHYPSNSRSAFAKHRSKHRQARSLSKAHGRKPSPANVIRRAVKQLNDQLREAAKRAKLKARAEQESDRARERESRRLQIAALASALDIAKGLMTQDKGAGTIQTDTDQATSRVVMMHDDVNVTSKVLPS